VLTVGASDEFVWCWHVELPRARGSMMIITEPNLRDKLNVAALKVQELPVESHTGCPTGGSTLC